MTQYFETTVRYEKTDENGQNKKAREKYLVSAMSFTEAEEKIIQEMTPFITGSFQVTDIKQAKYAELFFADEPEADRYYSCQLELITVDEKSGKEKKSKYNVLVQASNLPDAMKKLSDNMKGSMIDYNAVAVKETAIMDVFSE